MKNPNPPYRIGIDLLGSDADPQTLLSTLLASKIPSRVALTFFARREDFKSFTPPSHCLFVETQEFIRMDEEPLKALKTKKRSSLQMGIEQLKEDKLDALISCGNTGAILACSTLHLDLLETLHRPALLALLPTLKNKPVAILDVGANLQASSDLLVDFAKIGASYQQGMGIKTPKIALLNIGIEKSKGLLPIREAYEKLNLLQALWKFEGNIEAREVFKGDVDVVVTDGFSGNILLKTAEGLGDMILKELSHFSLPVPLWNNLQEKLSYNKYPGGMLCGLNKLVFKCHGVAHPQALITTLLQATLLCEGKFIDKLRAYLSGNLNSFS